MNYLKYFLVLFLGVIFIENVSAATYTPTENLFENTQSNYLFYFANSQIDNFTNKNYVAFKVDNNYYLVSSDSVSLSNNTLVFDNSTVISAVRESSGSYSYQYTYYTTEEEKTTVGLNFVVLSNVDTSKSASSTIFEDFKYKKDLRNIGIFVLGLVFAIFITKERRY